MAMMTSPDPMRVLVVDDHDTFAELLVGALDREVDMVCVGHATTGAEGVAMVGRLGADVVLMDIQLPDMDGFAATEQILAADSTVRVVMLDRPRVGAPGRPGRARRRLRLPAQDRAPRGRAGHPAHRQDR